MWQEISSTYFTELQIQHFNTLRGVTAEIFCDYVETIYKDSSGNSVLRKTEQENYDEVHCYPNTIKYFKLKDLSCQQF